MSPSSSAKRPAARRKERPNKEPHRSNAEVPEVVTKVKYVGALGNTPGHLHHWSRRGFARFLERRLEIVELHAPLPWTMALCRATRAI